MSNKVNDKTTLILTITFKDENGAAVIPTQAWYRIDCLTTGTIVKTETEMPTPASTMDLEITATENGIINSANAEEERAVAIRFTYGAGAKQGTGEYRYKVVNLTGIV